MAKNKIMVRVIQLALFTCFVGLCSCSNSSQQGRYYRYYVGTMKIENPVLVEFENSDDMWFVCPDSALYCCNDSDWVHRDDVFPYRSVVEIGEPIMTYFPRKQLNHLAYFMYAYSPYYEYGKKNSHSVYHFYYDLSMFECYMEAIDIDMFDNLVDDDVEYSDTRTTHDLSVKTKEFAYRLVVRDKYNLLQILRLKTKYEKPILLESTD